MTNDERIQALLKKVEEKKAKIKKGERPSWKTNCSFRWRNGDTTNLQVVADAAQLTSILAEVILERDAFTKAAEVLGTPSDSFLFRNFSYEDWESDIKTRLETLNLTRSRNELKFLEDKLNTLMSPELKAQRELEEIEKLLN